MQYNIICEPFPAVQCALDPGESMISQTSGMVWMSPNMKMETTAGGFGKVLGRLVSGESIFQNIYTAQNESGMISFATAFVGAIRAFEIKPGQSIICQKKCFLASEAGVELSVFFQKKLGAALFSGEGFIMQKLSGSGTAFIEIDGYAVEFELEENQSMLINTGYLAMMDETCSIDIETVKGVKNVLFGGEGLFVTKVTGPGKITVQTMSLSHLAATLTPYFPTNTTPTTTTTTE
jgi:uncharacterized protein (TIGR00266 family)